MRRKPLPRAHMDSETSVTSILAHLQDVERHRSLRSGDPALSRQVEALKHYQQQRFARTYTDLLNSSRYAQPARFFLEDLYGPADFSRRDAQFARVVPAMVKLFPNEVVATVARLAQLHALSESFDSRMATLLGGDAMTAPRYARAWFNCGDEANRRLQIELTLEVGRSLDELTRKPLLRQALRLMRGPAAAAGLAELQSFLEQGFDTFKAMRGASDFLAIVRQRELNLLSLLFSEAAVHRLETNRCLPGDEPLGQLP